MNSVVIVGFPRSGTTLLRSLLARHEELLVPLREIHYVLEFQERYRGWIGDPAEAIEQLWRHAKWTPELLQKEQLAPRITEAGMPVSAFFRIVFEEMARANGGRTLVLKHPELGHHLDLVRAVFPEVKVLSAVRDPRASVLSHRRRWPRMHVYWCASLWNRCVDVANACRAAGLGVRETRYEDLLEHPERELSGICEWIGKEWRPELLEGDFVLHDHSQAAGEKHDYGGLDRSRIDSWKTGLSNNEIRLIERLCSGRMGRHGYESVVDGKSPRSAGYFVFAGRVIGRDVSIATIRRLRQGLRAFFGRRKVKVSA